VRDLQTYLKNYFNKISIYNFLPVLLLCTSTILFVLFMLGLQRSYDINAQIERMKNEKVLILLQEWQATPYHCKTPKDVLEDCMPLQATKTTVTLPRTTNMFTGLEDEFKKNGQTLLPNSARLVYRFKIPDIDWINSISKHATYLSLVVPRTYQSTLRIYTNQDNKQIHAGNGTNAISTFAITDILASGSVSLDYNANKYSFPSAFGPITLPVALMVSGNTTAYTGLLQKLVDSAIPLTLLSLTLPVLVAAMAVILDSSKILFHISIFAFLKGIKAFVTYSISTFQGVKISMLGLTLNVNQLRILTAFILLVVLFWQARVIYELIIEPSSRFASRKARYVFAVINSALLAAAMIFFYGEKSLFIFRGERAADLIIAGSTIIVAGYSLHLHFRKKSLRRADTFQEIDSGQTLFNPTHFFTLRGLLVSSTVCLMALASWRDLMGAGKSANLYDPLDWRQALLVPVLLLSAMLGIGSVTQKIGEYARTLRRRVEQLMLGSRQLASSHEHVSAVFAALNILQKELESLREIDVEIILPSNEPRKVLQYTAHLSKPTEQPVIPEPVLKSGVPPIPDEQPAMSSLGGVVTLNLFQELRWLGVVSINCRREIFLTREEMHFIKITEQTLCLTLDNLSVVSELRRADKLKDDFLANTSHELRTPLHGIVGLAETLLNGSEGSLSARLRENLSLISASGRRLTNLVNDLLDFSQIKQRDLKLRLSDVELRPMVQVLLALNQPLVGNKPLTLHNNVEPNLPMLEADEARIQQILQNLIANAIKFTHSGHVSVSAEVEGRFMRIIVADTGIGIDPSKKQRIFNAFEQADGHINRAYGGTGLGLTITKQLVELHGGNIQVESQPEVGSQFSFTIPLSLQSLAASGRGEMIDSGLTQKVQRPRMLELNSVWWESGTPASEPSRTIHAHSDDQKGYKILVVDDEPINRQVLQNQLRSENYQLVVCEDGPSALRAMQQFKPDLVLLDLMMPRMSGLEVLAEIRKTHQVTDLPVIILTAKNQISDLITCFGSGANDFLMKPFSQSELLARMRNHLHISKIHGAYSRFIPQDLLQLLGRESIIDVRLGDQVLREMTVLFLDIRQFSKISETMTPKENFDFLNSYFATVNPLIQKNCGFIDKYIGDAVMALFPNRPDDALLAAIDLQRELENFNNQRKTSFRPPINIGIGVHHGPLMLGTLGNDQRMEGTVISDSVNLASRLEGITKVFSVGLITSQDSMILTQNPKHFDFRSLGRVRPTGFTRALSIVEIFNADHPHVRELKLKTLERHESTLKAFHAAQWETAIDGWKKILDENPADKVAALYLDRAVRMKQSPPPPEEWDGVFDMRAR
jgi:signal transduction histidine kinase/CheY-like chemotaxis protein/class 3 adenylate cyclase